MKKMPQIAYSKLQRKEAYRDLINSCPMRSSLPRLLEKAAKLYGKLSTDDLIELLTEADTKS